MRRRKIYVVGSLANPEIPVVASRLREAGHDVFDDWYSPGPQTDVFWSEYEKSRGHSFVQGLNGLAAKHNFSFDLHHLHEADTTALVLPCGKSGHLELGYQIGRGVEGHILLQGEPQKWDLMYRFAHGVWTSLDELVHALQTGQRNVI